MREKTKKATDKLRKWREVLKLSQPQAAEKLNTPLPTYRNWEQGKSGVPGVVLAFIEEVL